MTKSDREIMEILEAYDSTGCAHSAAQLAGCDPKTVRRYVALREAGGGDPLAWAAVARPKMIDAFLPKVEELVDNSKARIRADKVHERLVAMGFAGTERTTRRAVRAAKLAWRAGRRRSYRPWVPEPGLWLQFDWGDGPRVGGRKTWLFCAWLAWSRLRVVIPVWDQTMGSLIACLDATLRRIGGVPAYLLGDNAKTVTVEHVAGVAVRHPTVVAAGRHYGCTVHSCELSRSPRRVGAAGQTAERAFHHEVGQVVRQLGAAALAVPAYPVADAVVPVDDGVVLVASRGPRENDAPFDPESKGGVEATVRVAKADLVPTETNLRGAYDGFADLVAACEAWCEHINARVHRETGAAPADRLALERARLHPLPAQPHTAALGEERLVNEDQTVRFGSVRYSTPPGHVDTRVWCRVVGEELVVVAMTAGGTVEIARHLLSTPGNPRILDAHYPNHPGGNHPRPPRPRPRTKAEADFLAIGEGAHAWLVEAAATGVTRVRAKMARAVEFATIMGAEKVDHALGLAAAAGRFDEHDLGAIIDHLSTHGDPSDVVRADETHSAQPGTGSWERFGR